MERSKEAQQRIDAGRKVWNEKKADGDWTQWTVLGAALMEGRTEVLRTINRNDPRGKVYCAEFGRWLKMNAYDPTLHSKGFMGIVSHLLYCMEHADVAQEVRAMMSTVEKMKITHPDSMAKRIRDLIRERGGEPKKVKPQVLTDAKKLEQAEARAKELAEEVDSMRAQLGEGGTIDIVKGKPDEIALVIRAAVQANRSPRMRQQLEALRDIIAGELAGFPVRVRSLADNVEDVNELLRRTKGRRRRAVKPPAPVVTT